MSKLQCCSQASWLSFASGRFVFPAWDVFYRRKMYQSTKQNFIAQLLTYLRNMIDFMTLRFSLICLRALIGTSCDDPNRSWCVGELTQTIKPSFLVMGNYCEYGSMLGTKAQKYLHHLPPEMTTLWDNENTYCMQ